MIKVEFTPIISSSYQAKVIILHFSSLTNSSFTVLFNAVPNCTFLSASRRTYSTRSTSSSFVCESGFSSKSIGIVAFLRLF